jgi:hypothetical protein
LELGRIVCSTGTNSLVFPGRFSADGTPVMEITLALSLLKCSKGKALPLSFLFAVILILQLIMKRKSELDYYKKMQ